MAVPVLEFIADYPREHLPGYAGRANLCIFYEMCEFNKLLQLVYTQSGKIYKPTSYLESEQGAEAKRVTKVSSTDLKIFGSDREAALRMLGVVAPAPEEHDDA